MFEEEKHPRDSDGKFAEKGGARKSGYDSRSDLNNIRNAKETSTNKVVEVDMDAEIQKQFDNATPKERSKIAYRYIMDNLCGKYAAHDGREITISGVGADKMSHTTNETKIRVLPKLADLIKAGELQGIKDVTHKKFNKFAYYKVTFQIRDNRYVALLNVGIRANGESTLYDINPFNKQ